MAQGGLPRPPSERSSSGATAKTGSYSAVEPERKQARLGTEIGQRERLHAGCVPEAQKGKGWEVLAMQKGRGQGEETALQPGEPTERHLPDCEPLQRF